MQQIRMTPNSQKIIPFNKGINESLSALELGASELYSCVNYELADGNYAGLRLVDGYEIYDGTALASETPVIKGTDGIVTDSSAREAASALITSPNGTNPILAVFEFNEFVWAITAKSSDLDRHYLYRADPTGWTEVSEIEPASLAIGTHTQIYKYYKARFANYDTNHEVMVFANGLSKPFILKGDGSIDIIDADGLLPSDTLFSGTIVYPTIAIVWNQRLILAYPDGNLFFHQPGGDPTDSTKWDPSIASAGTLYFEDEITNLLVAPSSCIVFCTHMIKALKQSNVDLATGVDFIVDTYSDRSGAIWNTAQRVLGTVLFCDDRGISTLETTAAYGDFSANVISKNAQRSYEDGRDNIIGAVINRERNQYKICSNTGKGLIVTFKADKTVKGMTTFSYPDTPYCGYECKWIGGEDGKVYKIHEGAQSFNLQPIVASFNTSYFTYNTPTNFKTFKRGLLELTADRGTAINFVPIFDYQAGTTPKAFSEELDTSLYTVGGIWGPEGDPWGTFYWQGSAESREWIYFTGIGANMSLNFSTSTRYYTPHVFHNIIVTYVQRSMDF